MKRAFLIMPVLMLYFASAQSEAQTAESRYGNSLTLGASFFNICNRTHFLNQSMHIMVDPVLYPEDTSLEDIYGNYFGDFYMTRNWHLRYDFMEDRMFSVGVGLSCQAALRKEYDAVSGMQLCWRSDSAYALYGRFRYRLYEKGKLNVYCAADLGMLTGITDGRRHSEFCFEYVPAGICYGNRWFFTVEAGLGKSYIGNHIGVGYRF